MDAVERLEAIVRRFEMGARKEYGMDSSTVEGRMKAELVNHGLWPEQAQAVLDTYKQSDIGEPMKGRWNEPAEGYPPVLLAAVWMGVKDVAAEWLEENAPKHWARPMFTDEDIGAHLEPGPA